LTIYKALKFLNGDQQLGPLASSLDSGCPEFGQNPLLKEIAGDSKGPSGFFYGESDAGD